MDDALRGHGRAGHPISLYNLQVRFLVVSLAFLGGIVIDALLHPPLDVWMMLAFLLILPAIFYKTSRYPTKWLVTASLLALLLGAERYQSTIHHLTPTDIAWFNGRSEEVLVTGTLIDPPDYRDTYTYLHLEVSQVDIGQKSFTVHDRLLARIGVNQTYHSGDNLRLRGYLEVLPDNLSSTYPDLLTRWSSASYMQGPQVTLLPGNTANPVQAALDALRENALSELYRLMRDPEASVLAGVLLGSDALLSPPLQRAFQSSGIGQWIAIPGPSLV